MIAYYRLERELGYELTEAYEEEFAGAQVVRFNDTERRVYTIFLIVRRRPNVWFGCMAGPRLLPPKENMGGCVVF